MSDHVRGGVWGCVRGASGYIAVHSWKPRNTLSFKLDYIHSIWFTTLVRTHSLCTRREFKYALGTGGRWWSGELLLVNGRMKKRTPLHFRHIRMFFMGNLFIPCLKKYHGVVLVFCLPVKARSLNRRRQQPARKAGIKEWMYRGLKSWIRGYCRWDCCSFCRWRI